VIGPAAQPHQISHIMPKPSKTRKLKAAQSKVFSTVEGNHKLLDLLVTTTSTSQKVIFINALLEILPTAFDRSDKTTPEELFNIFTTWFGNYVESNTNFSGIHTALHHRHRDILERRFKKRQFISEIGLDWTADAKALFYSKVNYVCGDVEEFSFLPRLKLSMFQS
jgi:hypothetical protein